MDDVENMNEDTEDCKALIKPEVFISNIITVGIFLLTFYDFLPWKIVGIDGRNHVSLKDRFIFTLQLSFIDILPLLFCIFTVFNQRKQTYAFTPMDSQEVEHVEHPKGILENIFQQFIVKLVLSFLLCTILRSHELLILPIFTLLFVIGRFTFALGYSFGTTMNITSVILITLLVTYRLVIKGIIFQYIYWK